MPIFATQIIKAYTSWLKRNVHTTAANVVEKSSAGRCSALLAARNSTTTTSKINQSGLTMSILKTITLVMALCIVQAVGAQTADAWQTEYRRVETGIRVPIFNNKVYDITRYGASTLNDAAKNQRAINRAIQRCSKAGGGRVVVPAGTWHTGALRLMSGVNLVVSEGARLCFSADTDLYPLVTTRWEGLDLINYSPLIYAYQATDVAVTGSGTLDGCASNTAWWPMCGSARYGWTADTPEAQSLGSRSQLLRMSDEQTPLADRVFGKGHGLRPQMIQFYQCDGVLLEGVSILNSPFWSVHPLRSRNIIVRNVTIENSGPNGDGCNPESCDGVIIEGCRFNTGDDCIAIKSGRNADGRRWNEPSQNIIIRNCNMMDGHGGVVIGSEVSGGARNIFVENCKMDSPNLERVIRLKTNTCRGGVTENLYVRNITVGRCKEAVVKINLVYEPREQSERGHYPIVRNIYIDNITCQHSRYGAYIDALTDSTNVQNINISNCTWNGITSPEGNRLQGLMRDVRFNNVTLNITP